MKIASLSTLLLTLPLMLCAAEKSNTAKAKPAAKAKAVKSELATVQPPTPGKLVKLFYPCKFDRSKQPALVYLATGDDPRPLIVALHTWGGRYSAHYQKYAALAKEYNWNMIFPHFRGPNHGNPKSCGSDYVISDLEDAVAYMKKVAKVDPARVYLSGGSGGGHCSLLMAGRRPDLWTAVSSWCPISDLKAWFKESNPRRSYYKDMVKIFGGDPSKSPAAAYEARRRSPRTWLANARETGTVIDISTGIHDGHRGSVKISQAFRAFNELADPADRFSEEDIQYMVSKQEIPEKLRFKGEDPGFKGYPVLLRRQSGNARITIFEGGHDILSAAAFEWLSRQKNGQAPDWAPSSKEINNGGKNTLSR